MMNLLLQYHFIYYVLITVKYL